MIKLTKLNEASEVKFKELKPIQQKQVVAFQKVIGADHSQIFAGIHGMVVDIPADGNFGSGYRFGADTLKKLEAVDTIHTIEGSMPSEISKYRDSILKDLMSKVKSKYGSDAAKEVNGAF